MSRKHKSNPAEHTLFRGEPVQWGYYLSADAYDRLIQEGLNPETVDEAVLWDHAERIDKYDDRGRIIVSIMNA